MVYLERTVMIWVAGWLISSVGFIAAKTGKAKRAGEAFVFKECLYGIAGLLIAWPVAVLMYVIINYKQKKNL